MRRVYKDGNIVDMTGNKPLWTTLEASNSCFPFVVGYESLPGGNEIKIGWLG